MAERQADGAVELSWTPARDCDGRPVAGYQLYRRSEAEKNYTQLNTVLIPGVSYSDRGLSQAPAGTTYYYALRAVDDSAQASVLSAPAAVTVAGSDNTDSRNSNSANTPVSCFISSAYQDEGFHALSLLVLVGAFWFLGQGRRNKGALRLRSGPSALEERPPAADLRSAAPWSRLAGASP